MRLTQKEYDNLHASAKRAGLPLSTYMRHLMKVCRPRERPPVDWFKLYSQLCCIGNNLNQLTHPSHCTGHIEAEDFRQFRDDLSKLMMEMMKEMYVPEKLDAKKVFREMKEELHQRN